MKCKLCWIALVILSVGTLAFSVALSQDHKEHGQCAMMGAYDASNEETIQGTVQEVKDHNCAMGMKAVHLLVRSGSGTKEVCLGPAARVSNLGMTFKKGDTLEVAGADMQCHGMNVIVPREIKKVLTLR